MFTGIVASLLLGLASIDLVPDCDNQGPPHCEDRFNIIDDPGDPLHAFGKFRCSHTVVCEDACGNAWSISFGAVSYHHPACRALWDEEFKRHAREMELPALN